VPSTIHRTTVIDPKPFSDRHARGSGPGRRWLVTTFISGMLGLNLAVAIPLDEDTRQLLVEAVEAAYSLDLYHARCRSDGSNRRTENLNKLLASRLRTTVLRVQDDLFPERNYRLVQERLRNDFLEMLRERGGCAGVKDSDLPIELRARYDEKMRAIEALP
jgi:hypothetical protein